MPHSTLVSFLCRLYGVLLYAYPRPFRQEYGGEMRRLFRDRCRDLARTAPRAELLRFALRSATDWCRTTIQEQAAHAPLAAAGLARAIWTTGRRRIPRGPIAEWSCALLLYLFVSTTLVQAYVVPTGSMEGTLKIGDHILVDRFTYGDPGLAGRTVLPYRDVRRGDIVAFLYPEDPRQTWVKRVIGLPGDRIHLDNKQVIRNGRRLIEPYTQHIDQATDPYRDNFPSGHPYSLTARGEEMLAHHVVNGELVVPPEALFMMGDNRENSLDSRYIGFVPRANIVGEPLFVYWSYDAPTDDLQQWTVHHFVDLAQHFFSRTRWERTFQRPRHQDATEAKP